jgi:hypothetical protein
MTTVPVPIAISSNPFGVIEHPTVRVRETVRVRDQYVSLLQSQSIQPYLFGQIAPDWQIVQPMPIDIEKDEDGSYIVSDALFLVFGVGDTKDMALQDYISSLIEYYDLVLEGTESNSLDLDQSMHLKTYIQKKAI